MSASEGRSCVGVVSIFEGRVICRGRVRRGRSIIPIFRRRILFGRSVILRENPVCGRRVMFGGSFILRGRVMFGGSIALGGSAIFRGSIMLGGDIILRSRVIIVLYCG